MKKSCTITIIVLTVLSIAAPGYCDNPITKFSRGLCNIVTFQFEIVEQSKRIKDKYGSVAGMTYGLGKGIAMAGVRALVGAYEIATCPIPFPEDYKPILTDPVSFFPEPQKTEAQLTGAENESVRNEVHALLQGVVAAFDRKDAVSAAACALPDALLEYVGGNIVSVNEWKANVQKEFNDIATIHSSIIVESVVGDSNAVSAAYTRIHDYTLSSDKDHRYRSMTRWDIALTKTSDGWKVVRSKETFEENTRDGLPYAPQPTTPKF